MNSIWGDWQDAFISCAGILDREPILGYSALLDYSYGLPVTERALINEPSENEEPGSKSPLMSRHPSHYTRRDTVYVKSTVKP